MHDHGWYSWTRTIGSWHSLIHVARERSRWRAELQADKWLSLRMLASVTGMKMDRL